jgi:hypothetical protein
VLPLFGPDTGVMSNTDVLGKLLKIAVTVSVLYSAPPFADTPTM